MVNSIRNQGEGRPDKKARLNFSTKQHQCGGTGHQPKKERGPKRKEGNHFSPEGKKKGRKRTGRDREPGERKNSHGRASGINSREKKNTFFKESGEKSFQKWRIKICRCCKTFQEEVC